MEGLQRGKERGNDVVISSKNTQTTNQPDIFLTSDRPENTLEDKKM